MSILLKENFGNQSTISAYPQWFSLVKESLKSCKSSKRKQYLKLLNKAWEEKDADSKIIFLFDIPRFRCGVAFYDRFTLQLKEVFPSMGEMIEKRPDVVWDNKIILLIAVPPNVVRAISVPCEKS